MSIFRKSKIARSIMEKEFDKIYSEIVPPSGKADTVIGEIFRAVARISYRFYNDGDLFYEGYGCETAGPSATYLKGFKGYKDYIEDMENTSKTFYENGLDDLVSLAVEDYNSGEYSEENHEDSRDYESDYKEEPSDDEDDDSWM